MVDKYHYAHADANNAASPHGLVSELTKHSPIRHWFDVPRTSRVHEDEYTVILLMSSPSLAYRPERGSVDNSWHGIAGTVAPAREAAPLRAGCRLAWLISLVPS